MELYVTQLIEDLEPAHQPNSSDLPDSDQALDEYFEEAEQYISGENH